MSGLYKKTFIYLITIIVFLTINNIHSVMAINQPTFNATQPNTNVTSTTIYNSTTTSVNSTTSTTSTSSSSSSTSTSTTSTTTSSTPTTSITPTTIPIGASASISDLNTNSTAFNYTIYKSIGSMLRKRLGSSIIIGSNAISNLNNASQINTSQISILDSFASSMAGHFSNFRGNFSVKSIVLNYTYGAFMHNGRLVPANTIMNFSSMDNHTGSIYI